MGTRRIDSVTIYQLRDVGRRAALGQRIYLERNGAAPDGGEPLWDAVLPQKFGVDVICAVCGTDFQGRRSTRRYCSEACRAKAAYGRRTDKRRAGR